MLTGHNAVLRSRLHAETWALPVHVLDFVGDPAPWFAAADLLLTKAGPSTLYEASYAGLPLILTGFIPGQEAANVTWVEEAGAGVYAPQPAQAARVAAQWLNERATLETVAAHARTLAPPDAADIVADLVISYLQDRGAA